LGEAAGPLICIGVITGAQGVRGAVRIKSFTALPEDVAAYGPVADETGQRIFALHPVGRAKGVVIATISGVVDRDAAERLKGVRLYVARDKLPAPGEEEYYHADLIGLAAVLRDGTLLGRVRAVHEYGAGDSLEVARESGGTVIVPFTRAAVPEVDLAAGRLVIDPPDGLLDARTVEAEMTAEVSDRDELPPPLAGEDRGGGSRRLRRSRGPRRVPPP
jgi:16S rRNA processing protein RimM